MTERDDLPDLATHFPAEGHYWRDFESITIQDAALLSLGIEPRAILEHRQQAQADAFNSLTGALETEKPLLHLGQQHVEFERRHAVISNAVSCKVLSTVEKQGQGTSKEIRLADFVTWASAKPWAMPEWLRELGPASLQAPAPQARQGRENQYATTRELRRLWQQETERLKSGNPRLSKSAIAEMISKTSIANDRKPDTIRQNIKF